MRTGVTATDVLWHWILPGRSIGSRKCSRTPACRMSRNATVRIACVNNEGLRRRWRWTGCVRLRNPSHLLLAQPSHLERHSRCWLERGGGCQPMTTQGGLGTLECTSPAVVGRQDKTCQQPSEAFSFWTRQGVGNVVLRLWHHLNQCQGGIITSVFWSEFILS